MGAEGGETLKEKPGILEFVFKGWDGPQGSIVGTDLGNRCTHCACETERYTAMF